MSKNWKGYDTEPWTGITYKGNRELKLKFLLLDPHCYWCRKAVKDYGEIVAGSRPPQDEASIDHIISRFFRKKGEVSPKVLACSPCNQRRSGEEGKMYTRLHQEKLLKERQELSPPLT